MASKGKYEQWWKSDVLNTKGHWAQEFVWSVLSSKGTDSYDIKMSDKGFLCNCPSFRRCKHIAQVEEGFVGE